MRIILTSLALFSASCVQAQVASCLYRRLLHVCKSQLAAYTHVCVLWAVWTLENLLVRANHFGNAHVGQYVPTWQKQRLQTGWRYFLGHWTCENGMERELICKKQLEWHSLAAECRSSSHHIVLEKSTALDYLWYSHCTSCYNDSKGGHIILHTSTEFSR
jgi:hypothetical protein